MARNIKKQFVVAIALLGFANFACAEWIKLGDSEDKSVTFYWNNTMMQRSGNMVKMWKLFDHASPTTVGTTTFLSGKDFSEYDCSKNMFRYLTSSYYSKNMGGGAVVYSESTPSAWQNISPESITEAYLRIACKKK